MNVTRAAAPDAKAPRLAPEKDEERAHYAADLYADSEMLFENDKHLDKNDSGNQVSITVTHDELHDNDVLCDQSGRIKLADSENLKFLSLVRAVMGISNGNLNDEMVEQVINIVYASHGRFLKKMDDAWHQMEEAETVSSVQQALSKRFEALKPVKEGSKIVQQEKKNTEVVITKNDVLTFQGTWISPNVCERHPGNQRFQELIEANYNGRLPGDQKKIVDEVIRAIRAKNGRFLKNDQHSGAWREMTEKEVETKTQKALHEAWRDRVVAASDITKEDVLFLHGGGQNQNHPGNQKLRQEVKKFSKRHYLSDQQKISAIRKNTGRFLESGEHSGVVYKMPEKEVETEILGYLYHAYMFDIPDSDIDGIDVLCVPGFESHSGNQKFQEMVEAVTCTHGLSGNVQLKKVIRCIRARLGRFLENDKSGMWQAMDEKGVKKHIRAALCCAWKRRLDDIMCEDTADSDTEQIDQESSNSFGEANDMEMSDASTVYTRMVSPVAAAPKDRPKPLTLNQNRSTNSWNVSLTRR